MRSRGTRAHKRVYRAAIIGAGRIGAGFDGPRARHILTHAHALRANPRTELVAFVERNPLRGRREARRWSTRWFSRVERMFADVNPDVVVIATPDETHAAFLELVGAYRPQLVVCEKPPVETREESERVERAMRDVPATVLVNYTRRFDTTVCRLRNDIQAGTYGTVLAASGVYTKGLLHNGSHLVDLARFLFGEMIGCVRFPSGYTDHDHSVSGVASFDRCPQFHLMTGDERRYSVTEFDILAERARIRFTDSGGLISIQRVVEDRLFKGYRVLGRPSTTRTGLIDALAELTRHFVAVLDGIDSPRSTLADALKSHAACLDLAGTARERDIWRA